MIPDDPLNLINLTDKIVTTVNETYDEFIFECIKPWTQDKTQMIISKQLLINAIKEYQKNYPEECERLMTEYHKEHYREVE